MVYHKAPTNVLNTDWETPDEVFDYFNRMFHFELDAAASHSNHRCAAYFTAEDDALTKDWGSRNVWLNPPYDASISKWMDKAFRASMDGALVVALTKHASDTKWWDIVEQSSATVLRIRGRVHFRAGDTPPAGAPWPVAAIVFWPYGGLNLRKDKCVRTLFL